MKPLYAILGTLIITAKRHVRLNRAHDRHDGRPAARRRSHSRHHQGAPAGVVGSNPAGGTGSAAGQRHIRGISRRRAKYVPSGGSKAHPGRSTNRRTVAVAVGLASETHARAVEMRLPPPSATRKICSSYLRIQRHRAVRHACVSFARSSLLASNLSLTLD